MSSQKTTESDEENLLLCRGKNMFFWLPKKGGKKFKFKFLNNRIKPNNDIFEDSTIICMECRSQRKVAHQMKGHLAMIYHSNKWELMIICEQTDERITVYPFDIISIFSMKMEKKVFIMKKRNFVLKYVSLFIKDFQSIGGNKFCFSDFNDLASINSIDSCLDAGTSPTSISFPLSYQNDLVDNLIKKKEFIESAKMGDTSENDKEEIRKRKRKNREEMEPVRLSQKWLTIYIPDHNPFGDISLTSKESLILVPVPEMKSEKVKYDDPFSKQVFHAIPRDKLSNLSQVLFTDYLKILEKHSRQRFEFTKFHHNKYPVRFSILKSKEFQVMLENKGNLNFHNTPLQSFLWEFSDEINSCLPGIVVSMWDSLDSLKVPFPLSHYKRMQDRVGNGFGDRPSVPSGALNVYFGPNCSQRPLPSPIYGPGIRKIVDYDRNYYHHEEYNQQLIERINDRNSLLLDHANIIDNNFMKFIGINNSARKIWTQGVSSRKVTYLDNKGKLVTKRLKTGYYSGIGFFNKPHYDPNDKLTDTEIEGLISNIQEKNSNNSKLTEIQETIGIGYPTTVGYDIYNPIKDIDIHAYFISWGFVTPITNQSFHHFYGWSFPHCSSFPLYIKDFLVIATNNNFKRNSSVYIGSFGINGRKEN